MKVVDVAEFYTDKGGGVKTYINQKLRAAARLGHEMVIIAPGTTSFEEERHGGRVIWVKGPKLPFDPRYVVLWNKKEIHQILDREKPDIIEGSSLWTGGSFVGSWRGDAIKSLIFHQDPVAVYPQTFLGNVMKLDSIDRMFGFFWKYIKKLSQKYDTTIVSGDWLKNRLMLFEVNNPVAVPFGIDKTSFSPEKRDLDLRSNLLAELGLPADAHLFISVGRYHPEKRLSTIINGFSEASRHKPMGLLMYGSGPLQKWIERKASNVVNLKLMGFTANREELSNILASCDYFVHGSAAETFGIAVAEAICSGLPIVVPKSGGAVEFANPLYSEVYNTGDSTSLANALLSIASRDRIEMAACCQKASVSAVRTTDEHFDELFSYYQSLFEEKSNEVILS